MTSIIKNAAALVGMLLRIRKNKGKPIAAPAPKNISCRLVSPSANFVFTFVRSFGIGTYAIFPPP